MISISILRENDDVMCLSGLYDLGIVSVGVGVESYFIYCILYIVYCILYIVYCILYIVCYIDMINKYGMYGMREICSFVQSRYIVSCAG